MMTDAKSYSRSDPAELAKALAAAKVNVRGTGQPPERAQRGATYRTPNWDKWRLIPTLAAWKCVALSMDIDPDELKDYRDGGMARKAMESQEFRDRLDIVMANLDGVLKGNFYEVELRSFAAWVHRIGWEAPQELLAMADEHDPGEPKTPTTAAKRAHNKRDTAARYHELQPLFPFAAMDGLTWPEITITFTGEEAVRVRARDKIETFTYEAMGFKDRRRLVAEPNEVWKAFMRLAVANSPYVSRSHVPGDRVEKKRMSMLRERLKGKFRIDDDPIVFKTGVGYEAVFNLTIEEHVIRQKREWATDHDEEGENDIQRAMLNEPGRW